MKKITKALLLLLFVAAIFMSNSARSQGLSVNLGVSYGFEIEEPGIRAGVSYFLAQNIRLGVDVTYWLTPSATIDPDWWKSNNVKSTYLEFNGNLHYLFVNDGGLALYGIGAVGIHYASASFLGMSSTDTEIGLGIGAGLEYNLGSIRLFAEPKYFFTGFEQFKVTAGVRINLGSN